MVDRYGFPKGSPEGDSEYFQSGRVVMYLTDTVVFQPLHILKCVRIGIPPQINQASERHPLVRSQPLEFGKLDQVSNFHINST